MTIAVVVTFNSADLLETCLTALAGTPAIVVDNASTDGTAGVARDRFPAVRLHVRAQNGGYAVAVNEGLELAGEDDVLLLNPDVVVRPRAIELLERYLQNHSDVGIAVPRLLYPDGSSQDSVRRFPNPLALLARRSPIGRTPPGKRALERFLLSRDTFDAPRPIDWAIGAAYLVRRAAVRDVGGMNEWFFLYGEDVDWCYRMWQQGWEVHVVPQAVMEHRYRRLSSRSLDFRSEATRHHWASLVKLFVLHPTLLLGRGPKPARNAIEHWAARQPDQA